MQDFIRLDGGHDTVALGEAQRGCTLGGVISETPIVDLPDGPIRGTQKSLLNRNNSPYLQNRDLSYVEYLGIPYAEPPVGNLRFKPPQAIITKWTDVRDATSHGAACMQHKTGIFPPPAEMSEDCLYLDILTPAGSSRSNPKAVMVWIHGGGYVLGSTRLFNVAKLTVIGDVVVVLVNYRLDVFGFLSTGDSVVPGNMGLLDQQLAIRWVKENIALFGGDPERITLIGQSAGATSVTQHAISPTNKGLFQRVISQSGTIFTDYAFNNNDMIPAIRKTGRPLGCNDTDIIMLIECLQGADKDELLLASRPPSPLEVEGLIWSWGPVLDGTFFVKPPREMTRGKGNGQAERMLKSIDLLIGHNGNEGYNHLQLYAFFQNPREFSLTAHTWNDVGFLRDLSEKLFRAVGNKYGNDEVAEMIYEILAYTYLNIQKGSDFDGPKLAEVLHELLTDELYLIPALKFADLHAELGGQTFKYHFDYRPSSSIHPDWVEGADHFTEVPYVFGMIHNNSPAFDQLLSYNLIKYWSNFAKTGNPNEPTTYPGLPAYWPQFTKGKRQFLEISVNITSSKPGEIIKPDRVYFWTEYLPKIVATLKCGARKQMRKKQRKAEDDAELDNK
ncbi:unnamed protein product [Owenia fusiformis]|uniref:Carboxylic ester hydrolase n=1 Tax=Owenia fusiformis TaxID=6347 RepID=A0A8J1UAL9_OWEFU|nr:unnamed protein product [Owenia fusiformis]